MEVEQRRLDNRAMTYDEASMERSKSFVKALQELKNLRPQLYSAAEYCEKSYLHSEQKQMVLDNLKDYAVRALVNAVDHLGTVAYKLTDVLEQQTSDVSTMELKISCMKQKLLTCHTYSNLEGLRQQQLSAFVPRHHKHYILPNSMNKKVHFSPHVQTDARQNHFPARLQPTGIPASKTLSWHLASETESTLKGTQQAPTHSDDQKSSGVFHLLVNEENIRTKSSAIPAQVASDAMEGKKSLAGFRSFDNPRREIIRAKVPVRSKSVISSFFVKQKTTKRSICQSSSHMIVDTYRVG